MSEVSHPQADSIDISLDLRQPANHLLAVKLELIPGPEPLHLSLPAWTPGSYLIRDYVSHLEIGRAHV